MPKKHTYEYIYDYIKEQGDLLMSKEYINTHTKLEIQCGKCNDVFNVTFAHYQEGGRCPKHQYKRIAEKLRHSYKYVYNYIKEQGDVLISKEYKNARTKLDVRCGSCKEIWDITFGDYQQGTRCRQCATGRFERDCRKSLKYLFDMKFPKKRFKDCCGIGGGSLEFDCYNEIIIEGVLYKIGLEANGIQHYEYIPYFHRNEYTNLKIQQENDRIKREYAEKNGIILIIVPYWEENDVESFIRKELLRYYIPLKDSISDYLNLERRINKE